MSGTHPQCASRNTVTRSTDPQLADQQIAGDDQRDDRDDRARTHPLQADDILGRVLRLLQQLLPKLNEHPPVLLQHAAGVAGQRHRLQDGAGSLPRPRR